MDLDILHNELNFKAIRSGGPGGQHANKVSSKIILSFNLMQSKAFSEKEKELLFKKLQSRLTKENKLILTCDESRSQHQNKTIIKERFNSLIQHALRINKKRKTTKPSKSSKARRLEKKKIQAYKKALRRKPDTE
jgi:ribosome-associated protein